MLKQSFITEIGYYKTIIGSDFPDEKLNFFENNQNFSAKSEEFYFVIKSLNDAQEDDISVCLQQCDQNAVLDKDLNSENDQEDERKKLEFQIVEANMTDFYNKIVLDIKQELYINRNNVKDGNIYDEKGNQNITKILIGLNRIERERFENEKLEFLDEFGKKHQENKVLYGLIDS